MLKELRNSYTHLGISPELDAVNYLQFVMILQCLNYINKQNATDLENALLVDAWNSLATKTYIDDQEQQTKEGITYQNLATFVHVINNIFP